MLQENQRCPDNSIDMKPQMLKAKDERGTCAGLTKGHFSAGSVIQL